MMKSDQVLLCVSVIVISC